MPVFQPGNWAALKHGARSARLWQSNRRAVEKRLRRELAEGKRAYLFRAITRLEWQVDAYYRWLQAHGIVTARYGTPRQCVDRLYRAEHLLLQCYRDLEGRPSELADDDPLTALVAAAGRNRT